MTTPTPETPAGELTAAERIDLINALHDAKTEGIQPIYQAARDIKAAAVVQARAEDGNRREWHEGCYSFAEVEQAVEKARAEDRARIEAALALADEWERAAAESGTGMIFVNPVVRQLRAALTATEDGDRRVVGDLLDPAYHESKRLTEDGDRP